MNDFEQLHYKDQNLWFIGASISAAQRVKELIPPKHQRSLLLRSLCSFTANPTFRF
jgi:hypothetical protein